jgi:hypothetical protein
MEPFPILIIVRLYPETTKLPGLVFTIVELLEI